jgi:hypothetical protein
LRKLLYLLLRFGVFQKLRLRVADLLELHLQAAAAKIGGSGRHHTSVTTMMALMSTTCQLQVRLLGAGCLHLRQVCRQAALVSERC